MIGQTISHYTITQLLGKGGMGEVFRATDTKLGRDVAIKILSEEFANEAGRLLRFQREAKVLASLNHPNIASIYGVEEWQGKSVLVMELVDGQDLSQHIKEDPVPPKEALFIALQVAMALEEAHEKGIVHRDLKPSNIRITAEGKVKVLDFGLAKAARSEPTSSDVSDSPTLAITRAGLILGTASYMAPEQARSKSVDKRADIWAFGLVLYEMLTGKRPFVGEDVAEILAAVIKDEPDWSLLPAGLPAQVPDLLKRTLRKDPQFRLRDIGDARILLAEALQSPKPTRKTSTGSARVLRVLPWALAAVCAAGLILTGLFDREDRPKQGLARFLIQAPPDLSFRRGDTPVVSPDGRMIVLEGLDENGQFHLWLRPLESLEARKLPGTEEGYDPFWSPDSQTIGFFSQGRIKKTSISAGLPETVTDTTSAWGGTWSSQDTLLFSLASSGPLARVQADGGLVRPVTHTDAPPAQSHDFPHFLEDGQHFLFSASRTGEGSDIYLGSLGGETRLLARGGGNAFVSMGHLVFARGEDLMAQPFDAQTLDVEGEPFVIAQGVSTWLGKASYSVSDDGVLVYRSGSARSLLTWRDRAGLETGTEGDPGPYSQVSLSPDGERVLLGSNGDIWLLELASDSFSRLTFERSNEEDPVWSPDGSQILYQSEGEHPANMFRKSLETGAAQRLFESSQPQYPEDWTPDGRFVIFVSSGARAIYSLDLTRAGEEPTLLLESPFLKDEVHVSPNGKWIAYNSNESGAMEVYVASFPNMQQRRQVSNAGGCQPLWSGDSSELFYLQLDGALMATPISQAEGAQPGVPEALFQTSLVPNPLWNQYCVSGDGQRFLLLEPQETDRIHVVLNWFEKSD